MMHQNILYEFPLNERMRNFMRLENYFAQIEYFSHHRTIWDSQAILLALIEVLNIIDRNDIRNEVTKELDRNITTLSALLDVPGIHTTRLQQTLDNLQTELYAMQSSNSKPSRSLREDDLLNSVRQRVAVSANINSFDIPGLYYWLHQPTSDRQEKIQQWLTELRSIESSINLLNGLLRESATFETNSADSGFFQKTLNPQHACQLVRIELPSDANYFPESSGSKHRINIRFLCYDNPAQRPVQVTENVMFELSCCSL